MSGRVVSSVARLTQEQEVPGLIPGPPHTFVSPSADSRRAVVIYVHELLIKRLGGLSLSRKRVVRLTDRPDLTLAVQTHHQQHSCNSWFLATFLDFLLKYILMHLLELPQGIV